MNTTAKEILTYLSASKINFTEVEENDPSLVYQIKTCSVFLENSQKIEVPEYKQALKEKFIRCAVDSIIDEIEMSEIQDVFLHVCEPTVTVSDDKVLNQMEGSVYQFDFTFGLRMCK